MQDSAHATTGLSMHEDPLRRPSTVVQLSPHGADARAVADAAASTWHQVDDALSPIIGERGVIALFKRSLHLTLTAHPWLPQQAADHEAFAALHASLSNQTAADAAAAQGALLHNFRSLLAKLIGASLADRLLQPVPDFPSSGDAAQDTSP